MDTKTGQGRDWRSLGSGDGTGGSSCWVSYRTGDKWDTRCTTGSIWRRTTEFFLSLETTGLNHDCVVSFNNPNPTECPLPITPTLLPEVVVHSRFKTTVEVYLFWDGYWYLELMVTGNLSFLNDQG